MKAKPTVAALLCLLLAPLSAAAERIVTREGEVIEGTPRFEGGEIVITRADGSEVRLPRSAVERIELSPDTGAGASEGEAAPAYDDEEADDAVPPGGPVWRPRYPPRPPPPPYYPPRRPRTPPPSYRERAYDQDGLALTLGYHRGAGLGVEYQVRPGEKPRYGFGLGAQVGFEGNRDVVYGTYGATGRFYLGREHRFVAELGVGLNLIDPYLGEDCGGDPVCPEKSVGPEASLGYQLLSRNGMLFEVLGGIAVSTNEAISEAHAPVLPTFQLSVGYLFH